MIKESIDNNKQLLTNFGRSFVLVFNRSFMYSPNHPFQVEAINTVFKVMTQLLQTVSPSVFILNRDQFYVDEEPLDPRLSVSRIATHFKKTGMESISFYQGVKKRELQLFLEIAASLNEYFDAEAMIKAMYKKRIEHIKINHVFYKKVSAEDEVISREILDKVTPDMKGEDQAKVKQMFLNSVFNSVLQEDFMNNLNLQNLLGNPGSFSEELITADLSAVKQYENISSNMNGNENSGGNGNSGGSINSGGNGNSGGNKNSGINGNQGGNKNIASGEGEYAAPRPGQFLLHQLQIFEQDVEKNLSEGTGVDLQQIAEALFDMRQKLAEGIEAQKALGIAYSNEEEVLSKANEITDNVIIRLIKEEYKGGEISVPRLAQILSRLVPEASRLKRLLPKIKAALFEEGMSQADFVNLIKELEKELQSDGFVNILAESAKEIGIAEDDLIRQVKENPLQSAEMIYLASEIKKRGGDEKALTDLLVNYVENIGSKYSQDLSERGEGGENYIRQALVNVKTNLAQHLGSLDIKEGLLGRLEERVNQRMDEVFDKLRLEWINSHSDSPKHEPSKELTVLETLERGVDENDELGMILKIIREKVESGEIDENDFDQIFPEMVKLEQMRKSTDDQKRLSKGIMREQMLMLHLDKEIAKAERYKTDLSALSFALVKIKAQDSKQNNVNTQDIVDALLQKFVEIFRTPDTIGEVGKNNFIVLLPMTHRGHANMALRRAMQILHLNPLIVNGYAYEIKVAGVATDINLEESINAKILIERLTSQLKEMTRRLSNLHANS